VWSSYGDTGASPLDGESEGMRTRYCVLALLMMTALFAATFYVTFLYTSYGPPPD